MNKQTTELGPASETSLGQDVSRLIRHWFRGRRGWFFMAAVIAFAGGVSGWDWLVAAGIAPILVSLAPCLVMCALGLCMKRSPGKDSAVGTDDDAGANTNLGTDTDANNTHPIKPDDR
jgi:hypothetical protein